MKDEQQSFFDNQAATWEDDPFKVKTSHEIADAIIKEMQLTPDMNVLDYGCGSGLVTLRLQPFVKNITGMDSSPGMLDVLRAKVEKQNLKNVHIRLADLEQRELVKNRFHIIVISMTLHHIKEPAALLKRLFDLLLPGGHIGIADLDKEDGTFHKDNTSVVHFGFERTLIEGFLKESGFNHIRNITAAKAMRDHETTSWQKFPVFLIIATKP